MKAFVLNGERKGENHLKTVSEVMSSALSDKGYDVEIVTLRDVEIENCLGDFGCWVRTPGVCIVNDAGRRISEKNTQCDLQVFLTPVTFGGYSSELKKAVDKLIGNVLPFFGKIRRETHHKTRYCKYPRLIAVGVLPSPDEEAERIFKTLVARNAINMHAPAYAAEIIYSTATRSEIAKNIRSAVAKVEVTI